MKAKRRKAYRWGREEGGGGGRRGGTCAPHSATAIPWITLEFWLPGRKRRKEALLPQPWVCTARLPAWEEGGGFFCHRLLGFGDTWEEVQ